MNANQIQKEAEQYVQANPHISAEINTAANSSDTLFGYFVNQVKQNNYLIVSYILNRTFSNAEERAAFGNRQDSEGNTAYHYAAMNDSIEILTILNDKRPFNGKQKFFRFNLLNKKDETPLILCCRKGNLASFESIWPRIGKTNHNPTYCFRDACIGGNIHIIEKICNHPKFNIKIQILSETILEGLAGKYGDSVLDFFKKIFFLENNQLQLKRSASGSLKRQGLFKDKPIRQENKSKKFKPAALIG